MKYGLTMSQQPSCDCCGADDFEYGPYDTVEAAKAAAEHKEQGPLIWKERGSGAYRYLFAQSGRWWTTYSIEEVEAE